MYVTVSQYRYCIFHVTGMLWRVRKDVTIKIALMVITFPLLSLSIIFIAASIVAFSPNSISFCPAVNVSFNKSLKKDQHYDLILFLMFSQMPCSISLTNISYIINLHLWKLLSIHLWWWCYCSQCHTFLLTVKNAHVFKDKKSNS